MNTSASVLPQVNGVVLAYPNEGLTTEALRQRACAELRPFRPACWRLTTRCPLAAP